jgi:hypothetical protein
MLRQFCIAINVLFQLGPPPFRVRPWLCGMVRAAVPEAAVYEDCNLGRGESNVDPPTGHAWHWKFDPVAQARRV